MPQVPKPLSTFLISDDDLNEDPVIKEAYESYCDLRYEFVKARSLLSEATTKLHDLLDEPLVRQD